MIGKIKIENVDSILDPLSAIERVLNDGNDGAHIVYEFEDDAVFVAARDIAGNNFAIYELEVNEVFEDYKKPDCEIGVWDVVDFTNKLDLLEEDFELTHDGKSLFEAKSENDNLQFYGCDPSEVKKGKRKLKTDALDLGVTFVMNTIVPKIKNAIRSYAGQDNLIFEGSKDDQEVVVSICGDIRNSNSYKTTIKNMPVETDFKLEFSKSEINKVLSCNDEFDVSFYTGPKDIAEFSYAKDNYTMKFFVSPNDKND
jgi:hypothetical protein